MSVRSQQESALFSRSIPPDQQGTAGIVLAVDDLQENLNLLITILKPLGYQVVLTNSGAQALAMLALVQPDVILLDVMMPDMDGFEVARRIRAREDLPYIPIVMMTAGQDNRSRLEGLEAGADEFLIKPYSQPELLARTRSLVSLRRYNRALLQAVDDIRFLNELLATENQRMAYELNNTREAQLRLMPLPGLEIPGVRFAVYYKPALEVGGDYYDVIQLDDKRFVIVLGDAVGKGGAAVLAVAVVKSLVAAECGHATLNVATFEPAGLLDRINKVLCGPMASSQTEMTVFCGLYDQESRLLKFSNAGQTFPFLVRAGSFQEVKLSGLPIGLFEEATYQTETIAIQPGDCLALYSDGINEAANIDYEQFGLDRLGEALLKNYGLAPQAAVDNIIRELNQFCADATDDETLVIFEF